MGHTYVQSATTCKHALLCDVLETRQMSTAVGISDGNIKW